MGDVWVARNEATLAELAVKTIPRTERSPAHDERFRREARLSATISHRNVVRVFDLVDEADGTLGLVMELLRGGTLEDTLAERGALSGVETVAVALAVLSALDHVHQKGIVHRDLKPANVFFAVEPDGHVIPKLLDFGIAKLPAAGSALTTDGSVLGTPHYMSPEQIRGQVLDGRSDMFSFAVVLVEMLTTAQIFHRESAAASLAAVLEHEVDPDPRIDPRLWLAISRALAKRPYERYATCSEFADALRAAIRTTDEELAHALQRLRPPTDFSSSSSPSLAISRELGRPAWRMGRGTIGALALAVAAVVASGAAMALARRPLRSHASTVASQGSGMPTVGTPSIPPGTSSPLDALALDASPMALAPPPDAPPMALAPPPDAPPKSLPGLASTSESTASAQPSRPVPTSPRRPPENSGQRPRGSSAGIATTPGF